ncbi:MAG TPA: SPOR domain-containing protein, partial [Hyphomicrobium sp.]|nr:SPOR domain-containing protein [Hyphomicrobium sp.]
ALEATAPSPLQTAPSSGASANGGVSDAVKGPAKTIKVINADTASAGAALETGSVSGQVAQMKTAKPAVPDKAIADEQAFDTAIVKPAKQPIGVKVSTGASVDSLRLIWSLLNERHGDALEKLEPRYTTAGDAMNPTFDLVAGPIPTKADAQKICQTLTGRGLSCSIRDFSGRQL